MWIVLLFLIGMIILIGGLISSANNEPNENGVVLSSEDRRFREKGIDTGYFCDINNTHKYSKLEDMQVHYSNFIVLECKIKTSITSTNKENDTFNVEVIDTVKNNTQKFFFINDKEDFTEECYKFMRNIEVTLKEQGYTVQQRQAISEVCNNNNHIALELYKDRIDVMEIETEKLARGKYFKKSINLDNVVTIYDEENTQLVTERKITAGRVIAFGILAPAMKKETTKEVTTNISTTIVVNEYGYERTYVFPFKDDNFKTAVEDRIIEIRKKKFEESQKTTPQNQEVDN